MVSMTYCGDRGARKRSVPCRFRLFDHIETIHIAEVLASHLGGGVEGGEVLEVLVNDGELLGGEGLLLEHVIDRGVGDALDDLPSDAGVHAGEAGVDTDVGVVDVNDVGATNCECITWSEHCRSLAR